jgi:RND superfamily putative drug exporter
MIVHSFQRLMNNGREGPISHFPDGLHLTGYSGFVLAGTFAVLATIPSTELTEIGFAVAFGILLDTIVVRSVLVTALNLDVGRWMWWPSQLAQKPDPAPDELSRERAAATVAS